jgi:hypothetical protein
VTLLAPKTSRTSIRHFNEDDAGFILTLLNEPAFINNIGDKQVRNLKDAVNYLVNGPIASYHANGFGLYCVVERSSGQAIGTCGLVSRPELTMPDLGYAILTSHCQQGFAKEASEAVLLHSKNSLSLKSLQAVTLTDNVPSNRLLNSLGFRLLDTIELYASINNLYQIEL